MSYLVLARKSRPQNFTEVVGQRPVVRTLRNSLRADRVAHAILFSGVRGVGKTTLARIMAKALNCQADREQRPCNSCSSCEAITRGASLDLLEIDGASNRGIQEIRELKEKLKFLPTSSRYKIIIIDEVHMLTTEAFNALLKTLEEPPAHVHFMFATTELHKIPITILSRCQQYELKRISAAELTSHFAKLVQAEGFTIEPAALALIVREAGGSVRDGLSLLDQMFSACDKDIKLADVVEILGLVNHDILQQVTEALLVGDRQGMLHLLAEIFNFGMDIRRFLDDLMNHFRSLLFLKIDGCESLIDMPAEELASLQQLAGKFTHETLHQKLTMLMRVAEDLKITAQPRLTLETALLSIIEAGNVVAVSRLLEQLENIHLSPETESSEDVPAPPRAALQSLPGTQKKTAAERVSALPSTPPVNPPPAAEIDSSPTVSSKIETTENTPAPPQEIAPADSIPQVLPQQPTSPVPGTVRQHPHEKDVRRDWLEFIAYVKDRRVWMAQDLQRADNVRQEIDGELHLIYGDPANCSLLRQKENRHLLTEFALDFFQKPLTVRFILPKEEETGEANGDADSPHKKRQQLANDPLVIMAAEIFNGEVGDIRIGPRSR
jgi:DNA polymerase-3 subunit gamma/tau